jgi:hypothetical protein
MPRLRAAIARHAQSDTAVVPAGYGFRAALRQRGFLALVASAGAGPCRHYVGIYAGERGRFVRTLGGNEGGMMQIEIFAKAATTFGLPGHWWTKALPIPAIPPITVSADVPATLVLVT